MSSLTRRGQGALPRWFALAGAALVANATWEVAQRPLYAGDTAVARCLQASLVDAAYIVAAAALAMLVARGRARVFMIVLICGLAVAAASIEAWALSTDRWRYDDTMPTIAGLGLSPLIQLPLLGWLAARIAGFPTLPARAVGEHQILTSPRPSGADTRPRR